MKFIYILASLILLQTCSCQGQPTKPIGTGPVVTSEPPPPYMPSLIGDSVLVDTLSPFLKNALRLRYTGDPAIVSFRIIQNPFPRPDSFYVWDKLRCNMSSTRTFIAENTELVIDNTYNTNDLVWRGKLVGTGITIDRPDFNRITLTAERDTTTYAGYRFVGAGIRVWSEEAYDIEPLLPSYFVVVRYAPQRIGIMQDRVIPDLATR